MAVIPVNSETFSVTNYSGDLVATQVFASLFSHLDSHFFLFILFYFILFYFILFYFWVL